jgi:hypothetical protein
VDGYFGCTGRIRNAYKIPVRNSESSRLLERTENYTAVHL